MVAVTPAGNAVGLGAARAVADAVLYEGYLLYPYRRSSGKNRSQVRWQFGVLFPPGWARAQGLDDTSVAGSAESWWQQTECLAEAGPAAQAEICIRFLQVQRRSAMQLLPDGSRRPAGELTEGGGPEFSYDEAVPREFTFRFALADLLAGERRVELAAPGGQETGPLASCDHPAGRVLRRRLPVSATALISATAVPRPDASATRPDASAARPDPSGQPQAAGTRAPAAGLVKLRVRVENSGSVAAQLPRAEALRSSLIACHVLLAVHGGAFVSLLDPPGEAAAAARACVNVHTFPVLADSPGQRQLVLSAPLIMYDYPQIAPESPGDLHDAAEIDEILTLRALTLTDAEKREARATDGRAAAILDRVEEMPPAVLARLHGALRSPATQAAGAERRPENGAPQAEVPWWDPGADAGVSPATDSVLVAGVRLARGSLVRLRPRLSGTDPQDMFLDGQTARVEAVLLDVDGSRQLAVTLDGDPAAELNRWYGRYRYFRPEEVEPLTSPAGSG